jgi:hypothetical protein
MTLPRQRLELALQRAGFALLRRGYAELARGLIGMDYPRLRSGYVSEIMDIILQYLTSDSSITRFRNAYRRAVLEYFDAAYFVGYIDAGGQISDMSAEDRQWILSRMDAEIGYADLLFQGLKALREESGGDIVAPAQRHALGYARTLDGIYAQGVMRGGREEQYVFGGPDGLESCPTCQRLKGQAHKASYILDRDLIPYPGNRQFECGGWLCEHSWTSTTTGKQLMGP